MLRNLILAGGVYHPAEQSGLPLVEILRDAGLDSEVEVDIERGLRRLAAGEFQRLTVACLRFTMVQNEKYAPFRAQWALSLSDTGRATIRAYIASGKGLLGLHTAPISFDDWAEWPALLGVGWRWGQSFHPPLADAEAQAMTDHPITQGMAGFHVADEIYSDLVIAPWMAPLVHARHTEADAWRPIVFAGEDQGCRRAYCGFGHDAASFAEAGHRALIVRAARWVGRDL